MTSNERYESSGMSLPSDLSLPLFVYGSLKPGMPAYESIAGLVVGSPMRDHVAGTLYLRDGLPLLFLKGLRKISGSILNFDSSSLGYEQVCAFEPKSQYQWAVAETANGFRVNLLTGKQIDIGNPVETDSSEWLIKNDPAFGEGLPVVRRVMEEIITNNQWNAWEKFFRYQMAYLLLWSIVERLSAFCIGPRIGASQRISKLHTLRGMNALVDKHIHRTDVVSDTRKPSDKFKLNKLNPEDCFKYYYQVRSNLSHRGKAVPNELEKVMGSLPELLNITEDYLKSLQSLENLQ